MCIYKNLCIHTFYYSQKCMHKITCKKLLKILYFSPLPFCPKIQGAILVSSLLQVVLGLTGLVGLVLRFIGPLAIAPTINLIGLSLFIEAGKKCGAHWGIAALWVSSLIHPQHQNIY